MLLKNNGSAARVPYRKEGRTGTDAGGRLDGAHGGGLLRQCLYMQTPPPSKAGTTIYPPIMLYSIILAHFVRFLCFILPTTATGAAYVPWQNALS